MRAASPLPPFGALIVCLVPVVTSMTHSALNAPSRTVRPSLEASTRPASYVPTEYRAPQGLTRAKADDVEPWPPMKLTYDQPAPTSDHGIAVRG